MSDNDARGHNLRMEEILRYMIVEHNVSDGSNDLYFAEDMKDVRDMVLKIRIRQAMDEDSGWVIDRIVDLETGQVFDHEVTVLWHPREN